MPSVVLDGNLVLVDARSSLSGVVRTVKVLSTRSRPALFGLALLTVRLASGAKKETALPPVTLASRK
jgi:hypothetical protein